MKHKDGGSRRRKIYGKVGPGGTRVSRSAKKETKLAPKNKQGANGKKKWVPLRSTLSVQKSNREVESQCHPASCPRGSKRKNRWKRKCGEGEVKEGGQVQAEKGGKRREKKGCLEKNSRGSANCSSGSAIMPIKERNNVGGLGKLG